MLKNEYLDAKIGVDTAENELCKVWMWAPHPRIEMYMLAQVGVLLTLDSPMLGGLGEVITESGAEVGS